MVLVTSAMLASVQDAANSCKRRGRRVPASIRGSADMWEATRAPVSLCRPMSPQAPPVVAAVGAGRLRVQVALRSSAAVVSAKLVGWEDPQRLLQVGMTADKSGAPSALVDRGELDQEQYDSVRDVFVAPGGCTLVRADLFATLGG